MLKVYYTKYRYPKKRVVASAFVVYLFFYTFSKSINTFDRTALGFPAIAS